MDVITTPNNSESLLDALFQHFNAQAVVINETSGILNHQKTFSESTNHRNSKKSVIVALVNFLQYASINTFIEVWGDSLGSHFWSKFYSNGKYQFNFLSQLSNHNLTILENYLKKGDY